MRGHIIEMNVFISPFKVVDNSFVGQLLFNNEDILEKVNDSFLYVEMVKFSNHCFLIFQVSFIGVNESISFINDVPNIIKDRAISTQVQL